MLNIFRVAGVLHVLVALVGCASTPTDPIPDKRQDEIERATSCANSKWVETYRAAQCAYWLGMWAIKGWGTADGKTDKQQFMDWMQKSADKGSISASVTLSRLYVLAFATGKYESDKTVALITPAYKLYLAGIVDYGWKQDAMDKEMANGLTYRGLAYNLKGNKLAGAKDYCRAMKLNPKVENAEKWLYGSYMFPKKYDDYLRQES